MTRVSPNFFAKTPYATHINQVNCYFSFELNIRRKKFTQRDCMQLILQVEMIRDTGQITDKL